MAAIGTTLGWLIDSLHPEGLGFPAPWTMALAAAIMVALAIAVERDQDWARYGIVAVAGVAIPLLVREPFITQKTALVVLVPGALAALVAGPRSIALVSTLSVGILALRGLPASPYLGPGFLLVYIALITLLVGVERTMTAAMQQATSSSELFEAFGRETNEIITIAGHGTDGSQASLKFVSPSIERVLGYSAEQPTALGWAGVIHPDDVLRMAAMSKRIRAQPGNSDTGEFRFKHQDGSYRWVVARGTNLLHHPHVGGVLSTFVDVTKLVEERLTVEKKLAHDALHDAATGLPNRRLLAEQLQKELGRDGPPGSLLLLDIDGFKVVNDSLGHDVGDKLVMAVADRLAPILGHEGEIYRLGGDELAVLWRGSQESAALLAERVVREMRSSFAIDGRDVFVTVSVGVTSVRDDHARQEDVLRDADVAMYRAKARGRDCVEFFDEGMRGAAQRRHDLEQGLRCALERGEFSLVYQPRVLTETRKLLGFEALLRWHSEELGDVGPSEFIPIAEETGLIVAIGRWVLEQACKKLKAWQSQSPNAAGLRMAVNLSGRQLLGQADFAGEVREVLESAGVSPWTIELEVTESVLVTHAERSLAKLSALKDLGVKIAIDDFGTGYSSLSYLRKFPADVLKVDRSFVMGLGSNKEDSAIVHLVLTLAEALGLETVAEGVENEAQLAELKQLGCSQSQGYLIARPLSEADADRYVERAFALGSKPPSSRAAAE